MSGRSRSNAFCGEQAFEALLRESDQQAAATKIQALVRGVLSRKRFKIKSLPADKMTNYHLLPLGNDPKALYEGVPSNEQFALVATSGVRSVDLACTISSDLSKTPKTYIVDNSRHIHELWRRVKVAFASMERADELEAKMLSEVISMPEYTEFCERVGCSKTRPVGFLDIVSYFKALFEKHGFDQVKKVVANTSLIRGDWTDSKLFGHLKAIIHQIGIDDIYAYPSNIASCVDTKDQQDKVIDSVKALEPKASVFTDCCPVHDKPENSKTYEVAVDTATVRADMHLWDATARATGLSSNLDSLLMCLMLQDLLRYRRPPVRPTRLPFSSYPTAGYPADGSDYVDTPHPGA